MRFVERNKDGTIHAHFSMARYDGQESIEEDDPALVAFDMRARNVPTLKERCHALLRGCDWTEVPSEAALLTAEQRTAWATYRQALRDLPGLTVDPANPEWPVEPGKGG